MQIHLEHLPADILGLDETARHALSTGSLKGMPVPLRLEQIPRPEERHTIGERDLLVQAIRTGHSFHELPGRAQTSLSVLAEEGSFCVLTGQQPGLCTSPLYSLYKGLQACRLATDLSRDWGSPVVPVFWNHGDDHDMAEVQHTYQLNRNLDLQRVGLAGLSSGRTPLSRVVFDEERQCLGATRALLAQMYGGCEFIDQALDLFFPRHGETFARAFTRTMTTLLGPMGLVVVEPDWIRPALSSALGSLVALDPQPLLREGSDPRSPIDPDSAALVFRVEDDSRRALRGSEDGLRYDGESGSRTPAELAAEIVDDHDGWSAGALLRPLVQDAVFPVAATIGGYGELGYHGQLGPLRRAAGLPATPFVPRITLTLTDPEVRAALDRTGVSVADVLNARGELDLAPAEGAGSEVAAALRAEGQGAASRLKALQGELAALDPSLVGKLQRAARSVQGTVEKLAQKAERVHANQGGKGRRVLRRINNTLFPRGLPQERVLGPLQFSARLGPDWIEDLFRELPGIGCEHLVAHLDMPPPMRNPPLASESHD